MGHKMKSILKTPALLGAMICATLTSNVVQAQTNESWGLISPTISTYSDNDQFKAVKAGIGLLPLYKDGQHFTGIQALHHSYEQYEWKKDASQVSLVSESINPKNGLGHKVNLGVNQLGNHTLVNADMNYALSLREGTNAELFYNRDWVETRRSLDNGIKYDYYGGSLEQRLSEKWTVIGLLGQHSFSDNNTRNHVRGKLIYDLLPDQGINLQLRHRQYRNSQQEQNGNYFNPNKYEEQMVAVAMRQRVQSWMLSGLIGVGRQKVDDTPRTSTHLYELEANSPITKSIVFRSKLGYGQSATFNGPDYKFRYFNTSLVFKF
jgi:hypothetical protein